MKFFKICYKIFILFTINFLIFTTVLADDLYPKEDDFDIDALVKRIDAKIAELEEQERQEQLANAQASNKVTDFKEPTFNKITPISNDKDVSIKDSIKVDNTIKEPDIVLKEEENKVINGVTDDQFFDDFFNDGD